MKNKRYVHIDVLECIAMFFVILYHATLYSYDFLAVPNFKSYFFYFFRTLLSSCVPIFFFVNGYLLFGKKFDLRKHIFKMLKLITLDVDWSVITLILLLFIKHESLSAREFVNAIISWKQGYINHLWYMGALVCIYLLFPLLKNVYDTNYTYFLYFVIICTIFTFGNSFLNNVVSVLSRLLLNKNIMLYDKNFFSIFNLFRGIKGYSFVYFCFGGIVFRNQAVLEKFNVVWRNLFCIVGLILSCFGLFYLGVCYSKISGSVFDVVWGGYDSIFTFLNVFFLYLLSLNFKRNRLLIRGISSNTLGIYFLHWIVICLFKPYMWNYNFFSTFWFGILYGLFILIVSLLVCLIMKRVPLISKLVE